MSHFTVLVFTKENGKTVDELLAPYDEQIEYAPYIKYTKQQAIDHVRKEIEDFKHGLYAEYLKDPVAYEKNCHNSAHFDYIKNTFPQKLEWTDEECYEDLRKYYEDDMVDANENLLSTYNPNSKWDWYSVGGRWNGYFTNKSGETTDEDYVSEIEWKKEYIPFAFIEPNGVWHEKGEMGWWAMVSNEKSKDDWENEFMEFVKSLDDNVIVTMVDCHI